MIVTEMQIVMTATAYQNLLFNAYQLIQKKKVLVVQTESITTVMVLILTVSFLRAD